MNRKDQFEKEAEVTEADLIRERKKRRDARKEKRRLRRERIRSSVANRGEASAVATTAAVTSDGRIACPICGELVPSSDDPNDDTMALHMNKCQLASPTDDATTKLSAQNIDESASPSCPNDTITHVSCPICKKEFQCHPAQSDLFLATHMSQCQSSQGRRELRKRRRRGCGISYKDIDDDFQDPAKEDDEYLDLPPNRNVRQRIGNDNGKRTIQYTTKTNSDTFNTREEDNDPDYVNTGEEYNDTDYDDIVLEKKKPPPHRRTQTITTDLSEVAEPLDDIFESDYDIRLDSWLENGVSSMKTMSERSDDNSVPPPGPQSFPTHHRGGNDCSSDGLLIPGWINDRLFPYQRTALRWMWELYQQSAGGIMGDEMGLGKTVQVSSFLGCMAACRKINSVLIIAPATLLNNWLGELRVWAPGLRRVLIHKSAGDGRVVSEELLRNLKAWLSGMRRDYVNEMVDYDEDWGKDEFVGSGYVVVTSYEGVRRDVELWTGWNWSYVVLDEGQKIRNPDADVTLACKRFKTPHRLLLSGTPIQNDLRELWSLFDFVFPGRLGTLPAFDKEFAIPIKRGGYANASKLKVQLATKMAIMLKELINPYLLRRMKKDIAEVNRMPGKTEQVLFCRLTARQRAMYKSYLASPEVQRLLRVDNKSIQCFKSITTLRKICNHPDLINDEEHWNDSCTNNSESCGSSSDSLVEDCDDDGQLSLIDKSGKFQVLSKILPLWHAQKHRVLIFCQWKKMLNLIQRFATLRGYKLARLDGNTAVGSRQALVDKFNRDESYFGMLMTTKTGGVGLNLTGANRIILYDPDWNPQTDAQARERAWRFGQKKEVIVYRLITAGTIEEKIYHRQIFKTAMTNQVLHDPQQKRLFSQNDLRDLFTLKDDVESIARGGDGMTETGEIMRGKGVFDPDTHDFQNNQDNDQKKDTISAVLRSQGLAGVFDHDCVDDTAAGGGGTSHSIAEQEMEEQAKAIAARAAKALERSVAGTQQEDFTPTWTGSEETKPRRFGIVSHAAAVASGTVGMTNGNGIAGIAGNSSGVAGLSSKDILSQIQKRKQIQQNNNHQSIPKVSGDTSQYIALMKRLKVYLQQHSRDPPTSDDLLKEFDDVGDRDAAVFRRMLNSMARVKNGRWRLKRTKEEKADKEDEDWE